MANPPVSIENTATWAATGEVAEVLIVGAGPGGLSLSYFLHRQGVRVRLIDKGAGPTDGTRAPTLWQRMQEMLAAAGLRDAWLTGTLPQTEESLHLYGRPIAALPLLDPDSPCERLIVAPQSFTGHALSSRLAGVGLAAEYHTQADGRAEVRVGWSGGQVETLAAQWVVAAEGAKSVICASIGLDFEAKKYGGYRIHLADVVADWTMAAPVGQAYFFIQEQAYLGGQRRPGDLNRFYFYILTVDEEPDNNWHELNLPQVHQLVRDISGDDQPLGTYSDERRDLALKLDKRITGTFYFTMPLFLRAAHWILVLLLTLPPVAGWAQGYVEGASLSFEVLPLTSEGPSQASDFRAYITRAGVVVPRFLRADKSQALLLGFNLEVVHFAGNRPGFDVQRLLVVSPVLGYTRQLTPALRLTGLLIPTLGSDFRRIKGEDVQLGGLVRGVYLVTPLLALRATLGFRQTFYGPTYILLGGLDWQLADKVRIFGDVPANLTISYAATSKLNAGLDVAANFGSYRLEPNNHYVRYRTFIAGLFAEYYVQPRVALRATAGYSIVRNLEIYQERDRVSGILDFANLGTAPLPISPPISTGLVLRLALSFRIFTP